MLNRPRTRAVRSALIHGTLAALLGMTLGCGASSPAGPTPTSTPTPAATPAPVTPALVAVTPEDISLIVSPSLVTSGAQLTLRWVAPSGRGCNGGGDYAVAIYAIDDATGRTSNTIPETVTGSASCP
jgi:hypothetical protein